MAGMQWCVSAAKLVAVVLAVSALQACANNKLQSDGTLAGGSGAGGGPVTPGSRREFSVKVGDIVYFTTDSTDLTPEAQQTLKKQAQWLRQYPQYTITIEGHADERGTREYNIALGARRATAVRSFLSRHGVNGSRCAHHFLWQGTACRSL